MLAVHPQPGGIGYRHWLGLVLSVQGRVAMPAAQSRPGKTAAALMSGAPRCAPDRRRVRHGQHEGPRLRRERNAAAGGPDRSGAGAAGRSGGSWCCGGSGRDLLRAAVRNALFSRRRNGQARRGAAQRGARAALGAKPKPAFFTVLSSRPQGPGDASTSSASDGGSICAMLALALFDEAAPLSADSGGCRGRPHRQGPPAPAVLRSPATGRRARHCSTTLRCRPSDRRKPERRGKPA